jgi:hypothetical protein
LQIAKLLYQITVSFVIQDTISKTKQVVHPAQASILNALFVVKHPLPVILVLQAITWQTQLPALCVPR